MQSRNPLVSAQQQGRISLCVQFWCQAFSPFRSKSKFHNLRRLKFPCHNLHLPWNMQRNDRVKGISCYVRPNRISRPACNAFLSFKRRTFYKGRTKTNTNSLQPELHNTRNDVVQLRAFFLSSCRNSGDRSRRRDFISFQTFSFQSVSFFLAFLDVYIMTVWDQVHIQVSRRPQLIF